jgi:hypothetical protein
MVQGLVHAPATLVEAYHRDEGVTRYGQALDTTPPHVIVGAVV